MTQNTSTDVTVTLTRDELIKTANLLQLVTACGYDLNGTFPSGHPTRGINGQLLKSVFRKLFLANMSRGDPDMGEPAAPAVVPESFLVSALENTAAVSDTVFSNPADYARFYEAHAEELGGFPNIWKLCGLAGRAFAQAELDLKNVWDGGCAWIETIETFAETIMKDGGPFDYDGLHQLALKLIQNGKDKP